MDRLGDEQDRFGQQSLFRPTVLMCCRNLVDLLTENSIRFAGAWGKRNAPTMSWWRSAMVCRQRAAQAAGAGRHQLHYV